MAIKYRRLTYRDYDASALLSAVEIRIVLRYRLMQQYRARARAADGYMQKMYREVADVAEDGLRLLLAVRREARES